MVIGTYNGANIIALPSRPAPKQIELGMNDAVSIARSPYSGVTQTMVWSGGDFWDASVVLPQMVRADAAVWSAFLAECRGMANVFYLTDTLHVKPQGNASGSSPVVNGAQSAMLTTLNTRGWKPNTFGVLKPGDLFQLGVHLHRVLEQVNSDANGDATITIWPSLRDAPTDGEQVVLNNPQGLFRLATNRRSVMSNETLLSAVELKCVEAR